MGAKKCFKENEGAQIHALEAVVAALLFFGALQVGINIIPDSQSTTALDTISITGGDALRTLYQLHPRMANSSDYDNSSLILFVVDERTENITDFLNETLDPFVSYRLSYRTQPNDEETLLFTMIQTVYESVTAHLSFFHRDRLYDVRLVLWREPRGVIL